MKELNFNGNDPGAVKYGNFINYYDFHSATQRINNLNSIMFPVTDDNNVDKIFLCLDVGCNSGELTIELLKYLTVLYPKYSIRILALDIDPNLIERANQHNIENIKFICLDITHNNDQKYITDYLMEHNKTKFDITFCFSVTMWIHLNKGDDGLMLFLFLLKSISDTIIIEPQPWNCYRNAQRRLKKSGGNFPLYVLLQMRSNIVKEIVEYLEQGDYIKCFESQCSSWKRKIYSFRKIK